MKSAWQHVGPHNQILEREDFYISFNPARGDNPMGELMGFIGSAITSDSRYLEKVAETALVIKGRPATFLILNGDFRTEYEGLADQGLAACRAFYESQKDEHQSVWSSDRVEELTKA